MAVFDMATVRRCSRLNKVRWMGLGYSRLVPLQEEETEKAPELTFFAMWRHSVKVASCKPGRVPTAEIDPGGLWSGTCSHQNYEKIKFSYISCPVCSWGDSRSLHFSGQVVSSSKESPHVEKCWWLEVRPVCSEETRERTSDSLD